MNYEDLIFQTATESIPALIWYFGLVLIFDFLRTMIWKD